LRFGVRTSDTSTSRSSQGSIEHLFGMLLSVEAESKHLFDLTRTFVRVEL